MTRNQREAVLRYEDLLSEQDEQERGEGYTFPMREGYEAAVVLAECELASIDPIEMAEAA